MKSNDILYSNGKDDEKYTPAYGVIPILKYIKNGDIVWCPFDTENSQFVKLIKKTNIVVHSHIADDSAHDFYNYEPPVWDVLISNPPFTGKKKIFERAISFRKPFALLMTNTWLNDSAPKLLFENIDLQLLMFDKRIQYINQEGNYIGSPTFSSSYYCWNFLPKQIIMERLKK